jgi:coenzyme F420 hydrogenase subunit beta
MNIKGKMLLTLKSGRVVEMPLKEVRSFAEDKCKYCGDFSSELADISVGGVGLNGRTLTVVRTERGEKILYQALKMKTLEIKPAEEFEQAYNLLVRLSKLKNRNIQSLSTSN